MGGDPENGANVLARMNQRLAAPTDVTLEQYTRPLDGQTYRVTAIVESISGIVPHVFDVAPPPGAFLGDVRLRIRVVWNNPPSLCGVSICGEVEDYTITVVPWSVAVLSRWFAGPSSGCKSFVGNMLRTLRRGLVTRARVDVIRSCRCAREPFS